MLINRFLRIFVLPCFLLMTSCAPSGPRVTIEPPASPVHVGDMLTVSVTAGNISGLTATEIHLSFDASVLEAVELKNGDLLQADFAIQNTFDNTAGSVDYAVAQVNRAPAAGSGILFEVVFRARAAGDSPLTFRATPAASDGAIFSDVNGMSIQVSLEDGVVSVSQP